MSDLLHAAKSLGLPCRGRVHDVRREPIVDDPKSADDYRNVEYMRVVTWTTDADAADRMREAGADVVTYRQSQETGYEISFPADDAAA